MQDHIAKQASRAAAAAALQAANPHLVPVGGKVDGLQAGAKNIRIELKRAFPAVKFSVKSRRFSMGDAIDVRWTDGPTVDQVEDIVGRYSAGSFDGMTDSYNYERSAWRDAFGDAKFVQTHREYSDTGLASAIRTAAARYGFEAPTVADFRAGRSWSVFVGNSSAQELVYRVAARRTWALNKTPAAPAMAEAETA